jgi:hypothetical protein
MTAARRLAAILAADVVGYSRLMGADEAGTAKMWRTDFVDPISRDTYGFIFRFWPISIMKITGWHGEQIAVLKIFEREFVW